MRYGPTNDNERVIAGIIDNLSREGRLKSEAIAQVVNALQFLMTKSDSEFMAAYVRWRTDNPVAK